MITEDKTVDQSVVNLVEIIRNSTIYTEYISCREQVAMQPGLQEEIDRFRRKNYEVQTKYHGEELMNKMDELEQEGEKLRKNPLVDKFLTAELAFCRMIQEMNTYIINELDFK